MSIPANTMLARLITVYGLPKEAENANAFMAEYTRHLDKYVTSELEEASDRLLAKRKYKTWPTIRECLDALEDVRRCRVNKMLAAKMEAKAKAVFQPKQYTAAEQREAERFVDDCAAGKVDMGLCHAALRRMALAMQAKRRRAQQ